jgi:hypothetical protein
MDDRGYVREDPTWGIIRDQLAQRPVGPFDAGHPRNILMAPVIEKFNMAASSPTPENLRQLRGAAIMAKVKLFKLHHGRTLSSPGITLYEHDDKNILPFILDLTQTHEVELPGLVPVKNVLNVLGFFSYTGGERSIIAALEEFDVDSIMDSIWEGDAVRVATHRELTRENIKAVLSFMKAIR